MTLEILQKEMDDENAVYQWRRVYLRKKYEDDPYEVNEDGFIVVEADPMTLRLVSLDNQGNRIE